MKILDKFNWMFFVILFILISNPSNGLSSTITVDVSQTKGSVNRQVLGENLLGFGGHADNGAGIWDSKWDKPVDEVIQLAKNIGVTAVRFPGGGGSDNYDWKKTVGKDRKTFLFGIDEFIQVAEDIGAIPVYTVSYFTGTPQDAADLVEYLNGPDDGKHPWAARRAKNGHSRPYGVRYFEIGNEVNFKITPDEYIKEYLKYFDAMKKVDPDVQIGIVLYDEKWDRVVIPKIADRVDFGIIHAYPTPVWGKKLENMPMRQIFDVSLAEPETKYQPLFDQTRELFQQYSGKEVPLAITEFNGGFAQEKPVPYRFTLGNALINAELLKLFMKPQNNIVMANNWDFVNEYWGMVSNGFQGDSADLNKPYYKRPNYYVFKMYAKHFGDILLKADVESDGYNIDKYDELKSFLKRIETGALIEPNLLKGDWQISDDPGVVIVQNDGLLQIDFQNPVNFNFYHASQKARVEPDSYYKVSGHIRTEDLVDDKGVCLEIQDARGWSVTHSEAHTDPITGTSGWQYVEMVYQALPDADAVRVVARRIGDGSPLHGKASFKDVKLEKFIPSIDTQIPYLSVNASKSLDGNKIYLMIINKNLDEAMTATINLKNFVPVASGDVWILSGASVDATNEQNHDNIKVVHRAFLISHDPFEFTFEPHSLTAIEINKAK